MVITRLKERIALLLLGDLICFILALGMALVLRNAGIPPSSLLKLHLVPFGILFALSIVSFYISGLYAKHTLIFKRRLPKFLLSAQLVNMVIAISLFYFIPSFRLTPKTVLFLYIGVSSLFVFLWRLYIRELLAPKKRLNALIVGAGEEVRELIEEVNDNSRYTFAFQKIIDVSEKSNVSLLRSLRRRLEADSASFIVVDTHDTRCAPVIAELYAAGKGRHIIDFAQIYEDVFDRVSLQSFDAARFIEHESSSAHALYDALKRSLDVFLGLVLSFIGIIIYPFVFLFMKIEDGGPVLIPQMRLGEQGQPMKVYKLRTMERSEEASAMWVGENKNRVTRIGKILRKTSLDEIPQVFTIFRGDMSLIGPRADIEGLGKRLRSEIPYYMLRYRIKPGISGWAQIQQIYKKGNISPQSVEETKLRLAYDLYYIKNRSIFLDLTITFRTVAILVSRLLA